MTTREREIRLAAPPDFRLPPLTDPGGGVFEGGAETTRTVTTYWDTEDLRLVRAGASLRHGDDDGWHVSLPRSPGSDAPAWSAQRPEGDPTAPPGTALDLVRALVRGETVKAVATLTTTRRRVPVHGPDGVRIAAVVDDDIQTGDRAVVPRLRELVVEWQNGATRQQRTAVLARLRSVGAEEVEPAPTVVRALGQRAQAPAEFAPRPVADGAGVPEVVRHALATAVSVIVVHDPGARLGDDPEDVHQMRVAIRRIRSHLRTFLPLLDEPWATSLREELRWMGALLGEVRDVEVLLERFDAKIELLPSADRRSLGQLIGDLRGHHADARDELLDAMRSDRYVALLDRLVAAAQRPRLLLHVDDKDDNDVLRELVRGPMRALRTAVTALPDEAPDAALHDVRILAKRARYATEAVEPSFGKRARTLARALTAIQDVLGAHQDAVIAADWLRAAAARTDDERVGFAAGQLAGIEHTDALEARAEWPAVWKDASRKKLRDWL